MKTSFHWQILIVLFWALKGQIQAKIKKHVHRFWSSKRENLPISSAFLTFALSLRALVLAHGVAYLPKHSSCKEQLRSMFHDQMFIHYCCSMFTDIELLVYCLDLVPRQSLCLLTDTLPLIRWQRLHIVWHFALDVLRLELDIRLSYHSAFHWFRDAFFFLSSSFSKLSMNILCYCIAVFQHKILHIYFRSRGKISPKL